MPPQQRGVGCSQCGCSPCQCNVTCTICNCSPCVCGGGGGGGFRRKNNNCCNECQCDPCECGSRNGWDNGCCSPIFWLGAIFVIIAFIFSYYYSGYVRIIRVMQTPLGSEQSRCISVNDDGYSLAISQDAVCESDLSRFGISTSGDYAMLCLMDQPNKCWTNVGGQFRISDVTSDSTGQYLSIWQSWGTIGQFDQIRLLDEQGADSGNCVSSYQPLASELLTAVGAEKSVQSRKCPDDGTNDKTSEWYIANAQWS